ncbi:MAG: hypothetical protein HDS75_06290 [Bacteroidales bacterium]|nr:hypothetical protein [Bacteroidales bacterium]
MNSNRYNSEFWEWIERNKDKDPMKLRLRKDNGPEWIGDAIAHIENQKKSKKKFLLDSELSGVIPKLMPVAISVEQATSARIAQLHKEIAESLMPDTREILDMTCGLGVDTALLSTIPRANVIAIERDPKIAGVASENFKNVPNVTIFNADSVEYLQQSTLHFDLIFIDPARRDTEGLRVFNIRDCSPNVCDLLPTLKSKSNAFMIKLSPMLDVSQTIKDLPGVSQIYIVEQNNECRELLAVFHKGTQDEPMLHVINESQQFSFTKTTETDANISFALPQKDMFLLEPSAAMMKAAPFKLISERYGIEAIHPNTHLYIANEPVGGFIGKQNRIIDVLPFSSGNMKRLSKLHLSADVAVRNFPLTAEQLRQKLGIKKNGQERIVGITAIDGNQYILRLNPQ